MNFFVPKQTHCHRQLQPRMHLDTMREMSFYLERSLGLCQLIMTVCLHFQPQVVIMTMLRRLFQLEIETSLLWFETETSLLQLEVEAQVLQQFQLVTEATFYLETMKKSLPQTEVPANQEMIRGRQAQVQSVTVS